MYQDSQFTLDVVPFDVLVCECEYLASEVDLVMPDSPPRGFRQEDEDDDADSNHGELGVDRSPPVKRRLVGSDLEHNIGEETADVPP